jgi:hypothetical protein
MKAKPFSRYRNLFINLALLALFVFIGSLTFQAGSATTHVQITSQAETSG